MCKFCCVFFSLFSSENIQIMRIVVKTVRTSEIYSWTVWKHTSPCPAQCCKALKSNEQYHWGLHCCRLHCNHSKCITMIFTNASVHLIWLLNRINRQYFFSPLRKVGHFKFSSELVVVCSLYSHISVLFS